MNIYKLRKAVIEFDEAGKVKTITCTAEMPYNSSDVRALQARSSNYYWKSIFQKWEPIIQDVMQQVSAHGSEIDK
ncbi:MAG: hypothetical protein FWF09_09385 [Bacteroidales bacterium]|nr:hypothetical protein [Bacteroidales bacterium]